MALLGKLFARYGNSNTVGWIDRVVDTTADHAANATTDRTFSETIGRKADTAISTVGTTGSLMALCKYIANMLNGTLGMIGKPLYVQLTAARPHTGTNKTLVTATGAVFIKSVAIQKLTATEVAGANIKITSDDAAGYALSHSLRLADDTAVPVVNMTAGKRYVIDVNHVLATGKKLYFVADAQGEASGWLVEVIGVGLAVNASIA